MQENNKKEEKDIIIFISVIRKDKMITTWTETTKITDNSIDNIKEVIKSLIDSVKDKKAFIIDDIIATGGTIVNAVKILKEYGAKSVDVCCVHPILVNGATMRIYSAGANSVISTNSLSADSSRVSLAKSIANVLRD